MRLFPLVLQSEFRRDPASVCVDHSPWEADEKVLLDLRECRTSCLWWCGCGSFAAVVGGPAWLRTRRTGTPTSPQTRKSPAAERWRRRTARQSPSRRGRSPQMRSTSRSTLCPSLQRKQNKQMKRNSLIEDWEGEKVAGLRGQDAEEKQVKRQQNRRKGAGLETGRGCTCNTREEGDGRKKEPELVFY